MSTSIYHNSLTDILFEQAKEFVGLYDVTHDQFTRVNPAGCQLLGYSATQILAPEPMQWLWAQPLPAAEWASLRSQVLSTGRQELEVELRPQTGSTFWARAEFSSLPLDGKPFFLVRLTEANRLREVERSLAQSVRRFEAVFTHATVGIIVCNQEGSILLTNDKACELFGYSPDTLPGQRIEVLVPDAVRHRHAQLRHSFNAQPQVRAMGHNRDLLARRQNGSEFPVEISLSYFHLDEELFVVAYIIDITLKKATEQALLDQHQRVERLNTELEQKVADRTHALMSTLVTLEKRSEELAKSLAAAQELGELKSRFVSMASHEFRTPLTAISTSATLIEKYPTTQQQDKRQRHIDRIRTSVKHLSDILEEFLSVGKIEEGRLEARPVQLALSALVQETVAEVQSLRKAGQRIEQQVVSSGPIWLDSSLLRKVLVNLLSNALKYSTENTTVLVQATCEQQQLTLRVQDQGLGISKEDQEHLFERFFRARNVTNIPGTGLGLYIIARYLDLMGGTIALHSELNVGTTVTITVPYEDHPAN